ncbi:phage tail tape measure C-terminal domain-containing protein [Pseudomonas fluorescens]|uniref:Uncharacterized protein n=1 Tax=Pseudomonas fluorescens TaxID=294 RepID=A0A0F4VEJ9_PSEFL|nr:phage tail tape measure C-terminal domain-containing protein [Pseudomonas fluorescens]KJZ67243.1 hypothetical protein VD17_02990 [Pseudomonas fluorescens]
MPQNTVIQLVLRARDEASNVLKGAATKIVGLMAAFAGATAIKETVAELSNLDVVARKLNISIEDLTAAQYAAFKGANVGPEQFTDALEEVRIKIEEFNSINSGGAIDFFQIMKVSAKDFMKLNPLEQLTKISDVMKGMSSSAQFTFLDQIGSDNLRNLLPVLQNGSAEFKNLMEQAKQAGYTLNSLDAKNVQQLNSAFSQLSTSISSGFKQSVATAAPEFQALIEMFLQGTTDVRTETEGMANSGRESFRSFVSATGGVLSAIGRVGDAFFAVFFGLSKGASDTVTLLALGFDTILKYLGKFASSFVSFYSRAFADVLKLVGEIFVPGIQSLLNKIPGSIASSMAESLNGVQAYLAESVKNLNKPVDLNFSSSFLQDVAKSTDAASKTFDELGRQAVRATVTGVGGIAGAITDVTSKMLENGAKIQENNKKLVAEDTERNKSAVSKGGDAKNNLVNSQTAATIAATRAKLAADLAKLEIDKTIESIDTRRELEQKALDAQAAAQTLSANEIADKRLAIDLKANAEISDQRKKSIGEDIKVLQAQLGAQQKVLGNAVIDSDRGTALASIEDIESQITLKKQEQLNLSSALANQEAILKADRATALADSQAQIKAIQNQLDVDLLRIRGSNYQADLKEIEKEFADTKRVLEQLGGDSKAAQELVAAKKAKAELDEIDRQYAALKLKLERHQISPFDYLNKVDELGAKGEAAAGVTGNPDDENRAKQSLSDAKSEVFNIQSLVEELNGSLGEGFAGAFSEFISGTKSAKEAFGEMAQSVLADIAKMIAKLLIQMAIQTVLNMIPGGAAASAAGAAVKHDGGLIGGSGRSRNVPGWAFGGAMKYHTGGIVGLKANEVPVIAERGEEMLTASDPRHRNNIGKGKASGGDSGRVTINNVIDVPSIASALEGSDGERVIMNHIRANKSEIKLM